MCLRKPEHQYVHATYICMICESCHILGVVEFPTGFSFACHDFVHKLGKCVKRVLVLARSIAEQKCRRIAPQDHLIFWCASNCRLRWFLACPVGYGFAYPVHNFCNGAGGCTSNHSHWIACGGPLGFGMSACQWVLCAEPRLNNKF